MKKVALVLAVLLFAVPAWAGVTISVDQVGDTNEVEINYAVDVGDTNLPRAFALEITVDGTNSVLSDPYDIHSEFYVYPGSIVISGGVVTDAGTPVASKSNTSMTIEMGSLYAANDPCHTSPPPASGTLLRFTVASDDPNVDVCTAGNAPRGNVVMENPDITFDDPGYVTYECNDIILGGCTCWGDIADTLQQQPPDGIVEIGDLNYLIYQLYINGWSIDPAARPDMACADVANTLQQPPGDGIIEIGDLNYIIYQLYINGWSMGCMQMP